MRDIGDQGAREGSELADEIMRLVRRNSVLVAVDALSKVVGLFFVERFGRASRGGLSEFTQLAEAQRDVLEEMFAAEARKRTLACSHAREGAGLSTLARE